MPSALLVPPTQLKKDLQDPFRISSKPHPVSYDSADECSFAHLLRVQELVESENPVLERYVFDDESVHVD